MTRGNQRETDRQRAAARNGKKLGKVKDDGLTPEQRRERDAKALQEKAAKKAANAAGANYIDKDAKSYQEKVAKKIAQAAAGGGNGGKTNKK
ncbi:hypothetical protein SOVF_060910 [Spinacia oleracea]|uniref:Small EDRK-rich factor-like N-terminal domain-containing protein n=1 Tax=Spinacia oleracea TaxID=3562 RepID=A0A9R0IAV8_SPIOL|nr:uncharacterized protein LOC110785670 [Spinacia oleracea]KNA19534.1 hypothetical protein SOVF_060910 [Spinacia oleracea]